VEKPDTDRIVVLGHVSGLHGVQGWVKLYSETQPPAALLEYQALLVSAAANSAAGRSGCAGEDWQPLVIREGRCHGRRLVARFAGVSNREDASAFVGRTLAVLRADLPPLADDEWYWADLLGLLAINRDGEVLGAVSRVFDTGANDVLVIESTRGEVLVPFVQGRYILDVDLASKRIRIDWDMDAD